MNRRSLLKGLLAAPLALVGVKSLPEFITTPVGKWTGSDTTFSKTTTIANTTAAGPVWWIVQSPCCDHTHGPHNHVITSGYSRELVIQDLSGGRERGSMYEFKNHEWRRIDGS